MKRALIVTLIAAAFALSMTLPLRAFAEEPAPAPEPAATNATVCELGDGTRVARGGCCQRQGGICGCRGKQARCCDGTNGSCECRDNSTPPEEL